MVAEARLGTDLYGSFNSAQPRKGFGLHLPRYAGVHRTVVCTGGYCFSITIISVLVMNGHRSRRRILSVRSASVA